uniref:Lupus La protein homolog n=2 Tax=Schistocephalus solidus TaxID=70667 RepID=A0A0X3NWC5_SCHSO
MSDSELTAKILRQVEYYFGDINLSKDNFLKNTLQEKGGWLPFDVLLKFKRLSSLTTDIDIIKKALSDSTLVEVGPEGIRRAPSNPAPTTLNDALELHADKAVYAKGFPLDATLDEIMSWVEEVAGPTHDVFCRRFPNKKFKGSIFATFKTNEDAKKFLESTESAEYKGNSLIRKWYKTYMEEKSEERKLRDEEKAKKNAASQDRRNAEVASRMTPGALIELEGLPASTTAKAALKKPDSAGDEPVSDEKDNTAPTEEPIEDKSETTNGTNSGDGQQTVSSLKEWLNSKLENTVPIAWIDVNSEERKAVVRFKEPNTAANALEKLTKAFEDGKITYKDCHLTGRVISGDEEKEFWTTLIDTLNARKRKAGGRGKQGGGFRGKRRRVN